MDANRHDASMGDVNRCTDHLRGWQVPNPITDARIRAIMPAIGSWQARRLHHGLWESILRTTANPQAEGEHEKLQQVPHSVLPRTVR